ncbi:hypothetical protein QBC35DRAFT_57903 [Podospora australis]|uniref:NAD(P)-binding domain-containing protein n=1 Tax=Podospora australis TaxID=1536484 RepID=A0AAN7AF81_9PEZI|nr:hypothetical protein QBC35DRAFT_57903 [Podospora australis]
MAHITVLPASTKAGYATIKSLLASPERPTVRGIYRDPTKAPSEFLSDPKFEAVQGDVGKGTGLDFSSSSAVFYVPPPIYDGTEVGAWALQTATNVKSALEKAPNVKKLVLHSAVGAQNETGIGYLKLNHITDKILENSVPEVLIVKPSWYYDIWEEAVKTMREEPPYLESIFSPADFEIPMLSVKDIGAYCAKELLSLEALEKSPKAVDLFGPRLYSALDVKQALETITGKKAELRIIGKEGLREYWAERLPEVYVDDFVEFLSAQHPGGILTREHGYKEGVTVRCETELVDELRELFGRGE